MWRRKSKRVTRGKNRAPTRNLVWLCGLGLLLAACGGERSVPRERGGLRIRAAHLTDYAWRDRRRTGQPVDLPPEPRRQALVRELSRDPADVLILRGLGSESALRYLQKALNEVTVGYPEAVYLAGDTVYDGIGFLCRVPVNGGERLTEVSYEIDGATFSPLAGAIRVSAPRTGPVWIWNAAWPEPEADYERRRNEARMLAQEVRRQVKNGGAVLVSLHSREEADSPMIRMLEEAGLEPVAAPDAVGDAWTHRDPRGMLYRQDQLLFATASLADALRASARTLDSDDLRLAGDYRHQEFRIP